MAGKPPQRRCLLTGSRMAPDRLLRFAVDETGTVVPDPGHRLPGRGLWLAPAAGAVEKAGAKGLFARGARRKLRVPEDLPARAVAAWRAHVVDQVARARRAGQVLAEAAVPIAGREDALAVDASGLGIGWLLLRQTPLGRQLKADLALLAGLASTDG